MLPTVTALLGTPSKLHSRRQPATGLLSPAPLPQLLAHRLAFTNLPRRDRFIGARVKRPRRRDRAFVFFTSRERPPDLIAIYFFLRRSRALFARSFRTRFATLRAMFRSRPPRLPL